MEDSQIISLFFKRGTPYRHKVLTSLVRGWGELYAILHSIFGIKITGKILSSMTCYGSDQWDMIDYGDDEADDNTGSLHQAVRLGRYLSIFTDYGNEIDGLKYTAVSDMFYEFSGIAYNRLSTEQAESVHEILGITNRDD